MSGASFADIEFDRLVDSFVKDKLTPNEIDEFVIEKVDRGMPKTAVVWQIFAAIMWSDEKRTHYAMHLTYRMTQKLGYELEAAKIRMATFLYHIIIYFFTNDDAEQKAFEEVVFEMRQHADIQPYENILLIHKSYLGFRSNFYKFIFRNPESTEINAILKKLENYSDGRYNLWLVERGILVLENSWKAELPRSQIVARL
jgi:hypothetical protein